MSHPVWYTVRMRMRYDEGLDSEEIANYENKHDITPNKIMKNNSQVLMRENIRAEALKEATLRDAQVMLRLRHNQEGMGTTESDYANLEFAWKIENGEAREL